MTKYKRTVVEDYAPYIQEDGLVRRICRHEDLECLEPPLSIEEQYENRRDHMHRTFQDCTTRTVTEYFRRGREDAVKSNGWCCGKRFS